MPCTKTKEGLNADKQSATSASLAPKRTKNTKRQFLEC